MAKRDGRSGTRETTSSSSDRRFFLSRFFIVHVFRVVYQMSHPVQYLQSKGAVRACHIMEQTVSPCHIREASGIRKGIGLNIYTSA